MDHNTQNFLIIIGSFILYQAGKKIYAINKGKSFINKDNVIIIDVRTPSEFKSHHHPKSKNIPLQELDSRLSEVPKDRPIMLCCASGMRSGVAKGLLKKYGYNDLFNVGTYRNLFKII